MKYRLEIESQNKRELLRVAELTKKDKVEEISLWRVEGTVHTKIKEL